MRSSTASSSARPSAPCGPSKPSRRAAGGRGLRPWAGIQAKVLNAEQAARASSVFLDMLPTLMSGLTVAVILGVGGLRVIDGALTLGRSRGVSVADGELLRAGHRISCNQVGSFQTDQGRARTARGRLQLSARSASRTRPPLPRDRFPPKLTGTDRAAATSSSATRSLEPPLIADLSITIQPGARVALVGASGSGKSTLGRLICGLYKPWSGEILFDGWRACRRFRRRSSPTRSPMSIRTSSCSRARCATT